MPEIIQCFKGMQIHNHTVQLCVAYVAAVPRRICPFRPLKICSSIQQHQWRRIGQRRAAQWSQQRQQRTGLQPVPGHQDVPREVHYIDIDSLQGSGGSSYLSPTMQQTPTILHTTR